MKKVAAHILILLIFISLILTGPALEACSTFIQKSVTHLVFGRNCDWAIGHGLVIVNQRNLIKKSPPLADPSAKVIDMQTDKKGDISGHFTDYSKEINRKLIDRSFNGTEFLQNTPEAVMDQRARYPDSIHCRNKK